VTVAPGSVAGIGIDLATVSVPLRTVELFGRQCPLEVEIGSGKGRFLVGWAELHSERCFLGVERAEKYLMMAAARAARRGVGNVKLVRTTAEDILFRCLAPNSVAAVHVYFPDPWPKKRHRKRRFFNQDNVQRTAEVLTPGGLLRVKTDHLEYGEEITELLTACSLLAPCAHEGAFAGIPESSFEVKYAREGRPFMSLAFRRRA